MKLMNTLFTALMILGLGAAANAQPNMREPVTQTELRLLGKGYVNRDTQETLALVCAADRDGLCTEARFVLFPAAGSGLFAQWIGSSLIIPYESDSSNVEIKRMKEKFKLLFPESTRKKKNSRAFLYTSLSIAAASTGVGLIVGVPALGVTFVLSLFTATKSWKALDPALVGASENALSRVTQDQNGWNWSSQPDKVRPALFENLVNDLDHPFIWPKI